MISSWTPMSIVGGQFFFSLGTGVSFFFPFLKVNQIGKSYHLWNHIFSSVSLALACWLLQLTPIWIVLSLFLLLNSIFFAFSGVWRKIGTVLEFFIITLILFAFLFEILGGSQTEKINQITAVALLGAIAVALIVGHWYLVANISFGFLKLYTWAVLFALTARILFVGTLSWNAPENLFLDVFFLMRISMGLIIPLIFTFMTLGTLKYRNNQAATGILYVTLVLIIIGELVHTMTLTQGNYW